MTTARVAFPALGTTATLHVEAGDPTAIITAARALISDLQAELAPRVPRARPTRHVTPGAATTTLVAAALRARHDTGGAFDPTDELDLSGIAKGYIADRVRDLASSMGATGALVDLGSSSISVLGRRPDGAPWRIALRNPGGPRTQAIGTVTLTSGALSTSSNDERRHIPNSQADQATVVAADGMTAEIWSTALMVLGPSALIDRWSRNAPWQALIVTGATIMTTPGFPWTPGVR
ncbi:MAG: FAD:protein FMN transferase [Propionibacteriaceae bacterium]|nr:FAD:protein FMN transferase [Propionibacteriaceae bacterium]